jgi:hypothetical protein
MKSLKESVADLFLTFPGEWIDGRRFATVGGAYAWRTRIAECRKPPYNMVIENRVRIVKKDGQTWKVSEYRFVPQPTLMAQLLASAQESA